MARKPTGRILKEATGIAIRSDYLSILRELAEKDDRTLSYFIGKIVEEWLRKNGYIKD